LNADPEQAAAYAEHVKKIRALADDYNKRAEQAVKDVVAEGNKVIDEMNEAFLGPKVID
jgi:hypothetical protein